MRPKDVRTVPFRDCSNAFWETDPGTNMSGGYDKKENSYKEGKRKEKKRKGKDRIG